MIKIKIRDLPGSIDRYTVMITNDKITYFYAIGADPAAYNQFCGSSSDGYKDGKHLGKIVKFDDLEYDVQKAIRDRI